MKIFESIRAANLRFPSSHRDNVSSSANELIAVMLQLDPSKRLIAAEVLCEEDLIPTGIIA